MPNTKTSSANDSHLLLTTPTISYSGKLTSSDDEHGPRKISAVDFHRSYDNSPAADRGLPSITLDELIGELRRIFAVEKVDIDEVKKVLQRYRSNRADWAKFAKFDPHRYTRNLVDVGNGKYNLMCIAWSESQSSSIHDHSDAHCFMKMLDGELHEKRYDFPVRSGDPPRKSHEDVLKRDDICYINDNIGLHRVGNESHTNKAVSLHLYIPPFEECHTFDERTGKVNSCRVTFWSKFGERTPFQSAAGGCARADDVGPTAAVSAGEIPESLPVVFSQTERELL